MMELTVKIEANELTQAILKLANAISGDSAEALTNVQAPTTAPVSTQHTMPVPTAPIATNSQTVTQTHAPVTQTVPTVEPMQNSYTVPTVPTVPTAPAMSVQPPTAQPIPTQTAPTSVPNYTIEQLQTAIAPLLDAGKVQQIQALVQSFGVNTLMDIPQERYGEFANGLRNLGGVL